LIFDSDFLAFCRLISLSLSLLYSIAQKSSYCKAPLLFVTLVEAEEVFSQSKSENVITH
jgi:hypothetical protein